VAEGLGLTLGFGAGLAHLVAEWLRISHWLGECFGDGLGGALDFGAGLADTMAEGFSVTSYLGARLTNTVAECLGV
jgi:hypothetical protein